MTEYRAVFDVQISFVNGGGLTAEGFRLDLPSQDASEAEVGRLLVQHLGLALVGEVRFDRLEIVAEPHKGSRGIAAAVQPPTAAGYRLVDLSRAVHEGLVTSPGNTGTHFDNGVDRYAGGAGQSSVDLESVVDVPTEVFHVADAIERGIPASVFYDRDVRGKAVLLHTGWGRRFGTSSSQQGTPFLRVDGAAYLVEQGVRLVGIDSIGIDDTTAGADGERPARTAFLASSIHIVVNLTGLGNLPASGATFTAAPVKVAQLGAVPVRAFAKVPGP
ncbi:cyclase family protein [Gryllotalpicola reticulitermitis]|uniref:Cyclase family protein n=1 Tax=Gryllotalpicola reticulitermitis TaxID=1184153 RepID=A0ABV8Q3H4_9MICO